MDYAPLTSGAPDAIRDALSGKVAGIAVSTSGSTGEPSEVLIGADAIRASVAATEVALGGAGHWLLALPIDRIAGAMVIARAAIAQTQVVGVGVGQFTPELFARGVDKLPSTGKRYASLVPTQLSRLLASKVGTQALTAFDAVLVGGAALHGTDVPSNVVRTYGMTETAGGCVYNGNPIGDAVVRVREDGRLAICGAMLADAYRPQRDEAWEVVDGTRWLITQDLGSVTPEGTVEVHGRADDVISTGGFKVHPRTVEAAITGLEWTSEAAVVAIPDAQWGQAIVAFVVPRDPKNVVRLHELREQLATALPRHALPSELLLIEKMPQLATGKVNYPALRGVALDMAGAQ